MLKLPSMINSDGIGESSQVRFGGYNHNAFAGNGEIYDMKNMSSEEYPLLTPRKKRRTVRTLTNPNGLYGHDSLCWVDGTDFYYDGTVKGTLDAPAEGASTERFFVNLNDYVIIMPDKKYFIPADTDIDRAEAFGSLESEWTGASLTFKATGTLYDEPASCNTLYVEGAGWADYFKKGDAVTITGCTTREKNNKTPIIREIDGDYLRFYEYVFDLPSSETDNVVTYADYTETGSISLKRWVPDMDFMCQCSNRLWGCKGDTVYTSKLGDPFNWNVIDGLASDSWSSEVGSAGDFTGCYAYGGYPLFFKEEHIYRVYGSKPENFQATDSARLGVKAGCHKSLAVANEALFYLSPAGIVAYTGSTPENISAAFGLEKYSSAVGGSDGRRYYVSMYDGSAWHMFCYDTRAGLWHKEDDFHAMCFASQGGVLYALESGGVVFSINGASGTEEGQIESFVEFAGFDESSMSKKGFSRLRLRLEAENGSRVAVYVKYDNGSGWAHIRSVGGTKRRVYTFPVIPRRCEQYKIKIEGKGFWRLLGMSREFYTGSMN